MVDINMASSSKNTKIKIEDVCRTCLSKENDLISIFEECFDKVTLDVAISAITGIKIEQGDGLPTTVCHSCKENASKAYEFKRKSQEADITLRDLCKKEEKEVSLQNDFTYQNNDVGVKTEQLIVDDADNYLEEWHGLEDLNDLETVKNENCSSDVQSDLQCKNCYTVFNTYLKFQEHMRHKCLKVEFDDSSSNYCPLCGTCYYDAVNLTKHMWDSHADLMGAKKRGRPKKMPTGSILNKLTENGFLLKSIPLRRYNCTFCKDEFKTKEEYSIHLTKHNDTKVLCCLICKKMYLKKKHFDQHTCEDKNDQNKQDGHIQREENNRNKQNFFTNMTVQEVLNPNGDVKNNSFPEVCGVCTAVFLSEADLHRHNDIDHPELSLRCNLCTKMFASVKSATRHRSICKQIERKHRCSTCGLMFAYEISLNKHILRYHEGQSVSVKFMDTKTSQEDKQYKCDICNKMFCRKDLLIKHFRMHSEKYFECDVCKKKFNRSDNLRSHKRTHEPRDKTKVNTCLCLYCGRSFNNSSNLIVHMRRHTGEKPYKCDFCDKGFPRSSDLQCHRRSHTGEKPCVCGVCGKGFSRSNKLSRHMRVHTGVKPYKCTYCEKAFSQSNDLTLHIRRHTGDKPYICEVCGDRFIQGTALHNHKRNHGHFPASSTDTHIQLQSLTYTVHNITHQDINQ
ncbi:zinc finger protein 93-like [Galleria mellonella]|uniref:Zinc finger protein 93-like n=1 Tax=Galleria mellonella TaxID=7137 RepID=A0A6J3C1C2_GALME|nr:zinc finger protein 93-like [Galleria mellonella]